MSIKAVPYRFGIVASDSMNRSSVSPIGTSMAAVAVLLIQADRDAARRP